MEAPRGRLIAGIAAAVIGAALLVWVFVALTTAEYIPAVGPGPPPPICLFPTSGCWRSYGPNSAQA